MEIKHTKYGFPFIFYLIPVDFCFGFLDWLRVLLLARVSFSSLSLSLSLVPIHFAHNTNNDHLVSCAIVAFESGERKNLLFRMSLQFALYLALICVLHACKLWVLSAAT